MNYAARSNHLIATSTALLLALSTGCTGSAPARATAEPPPSTAPSPASEPTAERVDASGPAAPDAAVAGGSTALAGAWRATPGGAIAGAIFEAPGGDGVGDYQLDRVVQCIRAPCPPVRERGTYQYDGTAALALQPGPRGSMGPTQRYTASVAGEALTLQRAGGPAVQLTRAPNYCQQASDCRQGAFPTPRCVGYFECNPDATCGYRCGQPPADAGAPPSRPGASDAGAGVACGTTVCASGQYCCNPLRSMCARRGMMCIQ